MSSNDSEMDFQKSMKTLFALLSGSLNIKSQQFIATELDTNSHQLISGLLYYRRHNPKTDSLTELEKNCSLDSIPIQFLAKMSVFLDLTANQCKELFTSYLEFEFKGTPESVKSFFTNEKRAKDLLLDLNVFYSFERIFTLFCLKQILSHWKKSSEHVYQQIFHSFLETINGNNELLPKLMSQLVDLNKSRLPSRLTNGPYFSESLAKDWIHNNLKEQIEVLELLLLYFKEFETSIDNILELLSIFESNGFGLKFSQFNRNDCQHIDEEVFKFIGFLQSLLIVESLDLKWLYECQEKDIECQLIRKQNAKQLKQMDKKILNLNSGAVEHSPIFMSWMIVRSFQLPDFDFNTSSQVVTQLGSNALKLNVFNYLEKCLNLSQTIALNGTVVLDLINRSIADLLFVTFNVYDIELLGHSMPSLNQLCIQLFKNNFIAKELFKNGLDSGLGLIISTALTEFPFKANPVISFCLSLSETENCKKIFEKLSILSNLTSFAEPFDSSHSSCVVTEDNTYVLIRDKMLYRNTDLIIKKDTKGLLKIVNNNRVIEWLDINIDGWKLIYHRFKEQYELVSRGQLHSVSEVVIIEMSQMTAICSNLIKHKSHQHIPGFNRLLTLFYETYDLFSSIENPFRIFMASVLELSASVISLGLENCPSIWNRLTGKQFMPYMIGLTTDWKELIVGNDTNTSVLGQLITSEECLRGHYELCISFLQLIAEVVKSPDLKDDNNLMASLVFIIQEIFPSHQFWCFSRHKDLHKTGRLCFDIFYNILSKTSKNSKRYKTEELCINGLMEGKSAKTLLNVIKNGEINVRNVILNAGNDNSLTNDDQIVIVRQSLSVLNLLLVLHTDSNNSSIPSSVVEKALFSSQSKPNMLLIVSHYVFQRYDTHLATLAVQLLRQLSKRFPMSMLACLGSDAEAMRDHFLYRLETVTEDLNLKIALLNFLSACVERQPGLMEMFLNVDNDNEDNDNTTGCLQTVLEILSEKREDKYFCPFALHLSSLKFLYTFWVGPHLLAIDSLKKTSNVWTLITFPLFESSTFDNTLCIYVLRILAREVFYVKTLERDKFDCDLENKFKIMKESNRLTELSKHIHNIFISEDQIQEDSRMLLNAWKEFLVSIAKFDPFGVRDDTKTTISYHIIDCLLTQLQRKQIDTNIIANLSDILLIIIIKWKQSCIDSEEEWNSRIERLLEYVEDIKESLPFNVLNSVETSVIQFIQLSHKGLDSCEWISYSSKLLNQSLRVIEKQMKNSNKCLEMEFKLSVTSISLLQTLIIQNSSRASVWIQVLRTHFVVESLANLLIHLIDNKLGLELAVHIMYLLVELSSIPISAETLHLIGFIDNLCLSLQTVYIKSSERVIKMKFNSTVDWINVFHLSIQLIINLVKQLKHHFIDNAITYVAIHLDHMIDILTKLRTSPKTDEIRESVLIVTLCHSISRYHRIWKSNNLFSFNRIKDEILKTSNSVIAFLIRPNLLSYIIKNPLSSTSAVIPLEITPKKISPIHEIDGKRLRKSVSWETDFGSDSMDTTLQNSLFSFQAFSIAFLQNVSPNLMELMERQGLDDNWNIIINTSFSSPNVDPNLSLSFGSLIHCIHMCIKTLNRTQRVSETQTFSFIPFIFQTSLSFMVSQAMVAQLSSVISDVDKQIIVREIKSELNTILLNVSTRQSRRSSHSLTTLLTPKTATSSLIEEKFVKFLLQFFDKISQ